MKFKIAYLISITLAVIVSFTYLSARIELHYAQQDIAAKRLESELLKQQTQHLSATTQLSSPLLLHIAVLDEQLDYKNKSVEELNGYTRPWVLSAALLLWAMAIALWYQLRKQLNIPCKTKSVGWRLWLGRVLFYGGMALIFSALFLPNWQTSGKPDLLWILIAGLVLAVLGVALRVSQRTQQQ